LENFVILEFIIKAKKNNMSQKSNLITLNKNLLSLNFISFNSKKFLDVFNFCNFLTTFFLKRNIIILEKTISQETNQLNIFLQLFFKTSKISSLKKKSLLTKKVDSNFKLEFYSLNTALKSLLINKNLNKILLLRIQNTSLILNKKLLSFFYLKLKKYIKILFSRVYNLFLDFLKICCLFSQGKCNSFNFIKLLGVIFKATSKKAHQRFLSFLKVVFKIIIEEVPLNFSFSKNSIKGIKFLISGRLKDKTRASSFCIKEGLIPTQMLPSKIDYSKSHIYTLMGAFGFKIWVFKK